MKSRIIWFNLLPPEVKQNAITNYQAYRGENQDWGSLFIDLNSCIKASMNISNTPEGSSYWEKIISRFGHVNENAPAIVSQMNEYKAVLQYYGQPFLVCYNIEKTPVIENVIPEFEMYEPDWLNKRDLLILKPICEISDDDAFELSNILNVRLTKAGKIETIKHWISKDILSTSGYFTIDGDALKFLEAFDFLKSKGYDLPNILLGNKTLEQVGLAIYKY